MRHPFDAWHAAHTAAIVDASFNSAANGVIKKVSNQEAFNSLGDQTLLMVNKNNLYMDKKR